jgi:hypothetical protein
VQPPQRIVGDYGRHGSIGKAAGITPAIRTFMGMPKR